ncbi:MAG: alpha/beta hydrolase [Colwellia sp.]|nr:alpha/beta hydrolase [Colwellia sp.]
MSEKHIIFSHGKESGPWGSKIKAMAEYAKSVCDCEIHSLDYRDIESPDCRADHLISYLGKLSGEMILVGSSMGGYVSTLASKQVKISGLMLLAPAFYLEGYDESEPTTTCKSVRIIHGWHDDVVPYQNSVKFADEHRTTLTLVNDGHRLSDSAIELNTNLKQLILDVFKLHLS